MNDLKNRTKQFPVDTLRFCTKIPKGMEFQIIRGQLMRPGSSVGANYRAACRSKSLSDFINKLSIVEEEADESAFWLEILHESGMTKSSERTPLEGEANQLVAIMVSSKKTARASEIKRPISRALFETRNS